MKGKGLVTKRKEAGQDTRSKTRHVDEEKKQDELPEPKRKKAGTSPVQPL